MTGRYTQETCFIYKPGDPKVSLRDANISQRLRAENPYQSERSAQKRLSRFLEAREILDNTENQLNTEHLQVTLKDLAAFIKEGENSTQLSTIFLMKADGKSYVQNIRAAQPDWHCISIHSKECPNVKSAIKLIVNRFTEAESHLVLDRRLTYDFHVLIDWLSRINRDPASENLLILVEDTDGFDPGILRDLIAHSATYKANKELNLHLVLNLSVPLSLIEENLSQDNIIAMRARVLQGSPPSTNYLHSCAAALANSPSLQLVLSSQLMERVFDHEVSRVKQYLLYAILGHFAGNPLASVTSVADLRQEHVEILPRLPSVYHQLQQDPNFLSLLDTDMPLAELSYHILELQVGGAVLDTAFNPHYRPLIELALTDPRLFAEIPQECDRMSVPISVLYQLTRESSVYINIYDLYCAFKDMISKVELPAEPDDPIGLQTDWDKQSMAIFLETVTTFKMMGILRDCKRKFECVEKVSWKGV